MEYFLEHIAKSLYSEFGNRIGEQCIVFPNRRAGLFFQKYLAAELKGPVWSPGILTINELFRTFSDLRPVENEILLFELYKVYRSLKKSAEGFDEFFFWGDMLLNDFDDTDKYLVNASKLFCNVLDLKKIDQQFGGLTDEQVEIIKRFWTNFNPEKTSAQKTQFIGIWSLLEKLYSGFRKALFEKNIAYEGMVFRDVIENNHWKYNSPGKWKMFHFVGFNALNECEKALMKGLKQEGFARFYWDYDNSYIKVGQVNSAGYFLRDNISMFGNDMPGNWSYDTLLSNGSTNITRRVIDTSSDVAQVKLIPHLIGQLQGIKPENAHQTAIVLADENLLLSVLTSIPGEMKDVNVTMGYPLRQTSVYSLVRSLLELQRNAVVKEGMTLFNYSDVFRIIKNSLLDGMFEKSGDEIIKEVSGKNLVMIPDSFFGQTGILHEIFTRPDGPASLSEYLKNILTLIVRGNPGERIDNENFVMPANIRNEFIYRVILSINRLDYLTRNPEVNFSVVTWGKILDRILRIQSVPFSGEPLSGIQVMGILETRALDFKNLIMISVNEGILPSVAVSSSFVPFSIREAFGLPSINHQESVYAYHFYRLLHRSENVTFIYNSNPEGLRSGEISRFLQQMKYEPALKPEFSNLSYEIRNPAAIKPSVSRLEEHSLRLSSRFVALNTTNWLSPTAINTWLNCRMKFYFRYVNELKESEKISDEIDPAMLGTLLHSVMKKLYSGLRGKVVDAENIRAIADNKQGIDRLIANTIDEQYKRINDSNVAINELIIKSVLRIFILRILYIDRKAAPFTILEVEHPVSFKILIESNGGKSELLIGGNVDRIDMKDGTIRIVDYKTGKTSDHLRSVSDLFRDDRGKEDDAWLQTLIYCEGYLSEKPEAKVRPSVYKIKNIPSDQPCDQLIIKDSKSDEIVLFDYSGVRNEFMEGLKSLITVILSRNEPFIMTTDTWSKCSYCPYRVLCLR